MSKTVRLGVIGLGNIGRAHIDLIQNKRIQRVELTAVSSRTPSTEHGVPHFSDYRKLLAANLVDAVLIATPTMSHPEMGTLAGKAGLHVLMEKPLAMSVSQAQRLLAEAPANRRFAVMLNQRFHPHYRKIKSLIDESVLGEITRVAWTMTAWYRPDVYYQVSPWRGTWPGEGGGLLINQCIHNLDVLQWLTGLPASVSAAAGFGIYHAIDVEDEVTATLSYANGATGVVIASSGEAPGINQLDIVGDRATLRFDGNTLSLWRTEDSVRKHRTTSDEMFGMPEFRSEIISIVADKNSLNASHQHVQVIQNFVDSILDNTPLATPAEEGLASLHLANGMLLSAWCGEPVDLPLDASRYERQLQQKISQSSLRSPSLRNVNIDMDKSFR